MTFPIKWKALAIEHNKQPLRRGEICGSRTSLAVRGGQALRSTKGQRQCRLHAAWMQSNLGRWSMLKLQLLAKGSSGYGSK